MRIGELRKVKTQMRFSESGASWLSGLIVKIVEIDQGEQWEDPIVKVECQASKKITWMNPKDFSQMWQQPLTPPPASEKGNE